MGDAGDDKPPLQIINVTWPLRVIAWAFELEDFLLRRLAVIAAWLFVTFFLTLFGCGEENALACLATAFMAFLFAPLVVVLVLASVRSVARLILWLKWWLAEWRILCWERRRGRPAPPRNDD